MLELWVLFPWTVSPGAAPVGDPKMLELEKLQPRKVLSPSVHHCQAQPWLLLEHRVHWSHTQGMGITALGELARKILWKLFY